MKRQLKLGALFLLTASLFYGFAAQAQGVKQEERVAYALSLIDAGDGTGNTQTGKPVTDATTHVRVKVTVSIPREEDSSRYGAIPSYATPARLMFRKHRGPATAFDGTLTLTRDAPYSAAGASATSSFYPMPQAGDSVNYTAVATGASISSYETYLGVGQNHDPARWEATYLTAPFTMAEVMAGGTPATEMIRSLLCGEATYEWFAASRRGIGSVARISDIQDYGRNMTFRDIRLWTALGAKSTNIDVSSAKTLGEYESYRLAAMPQSDPDYGSWTIYRGAIGTNWNGKAGVQLLNVIDAGDPNGDEYANSPRIESPVYPDGVSSITFEACTTTKDVEEPSTLLVQYSTDDGMTWLPTLADATENELYTLAEEFKTISVNFGNKLPDNGSARFRVVRTSTNPTQGAANIYTYVIRNLIVRSAMPTASFGKLVVTVKDANDPAVNDPTCAEPYADAAFQVGVEAKPTSGTPRGYKGTIHVRRRAEGDYSRAWYKAPVKVTETATGASLQATFSPNHVLSNPDGSLNVRENAFFTDGDGTLTGMLPGVYDVAVECSVLGSFAAGRTDIDGFESTPQTLYGYETTEKDENGAPVQVTRPYVLNVRERFAAAESVFAQITYRTGNSAKNYEMHTQKVDLLPSAHKKNVWRVDIAKTLKLKEPTAVYALNEEKINLLAFKLCAESKDGTKTWYGQTVSAVVDVVPSVAETLKEAGTGDKGEEDALPILVDIASLPNSHLMVELDLANDIAPMVSLAGSFWQDFNTWEVSDSFIKTEFRENVTSVLADFDCEPTTINGETKLLGGWIPDEGPLADTTSFLDELPVGRMSQAGEFPFILREASQVSGHNFASWGSSHERATPNYLRYDNSDSRNSDYLKFNTQTEVVLRRRFFESGNIYRPDALFRLCGAGELTPRTDSNAAIKLNGVGKVSFNLSLSLPYNRELIAQIISSGENAWDYKAKGLSASVTLSSQTCAPSGYSVSYYLIDYTNPSSPVYYELRVSQIVSFPAKNDEKPTDAVIMELYKWTGRTSQRLPLVDNNGKEVDYLTVGQALTGNTYGLWVRADGSIAVGAVSGLKDTLSLQGYSKEKVSTSATFNLALGSAECRPEFRYINRLQTARNTYEGASPVSPSVTEIMVPSPEGSRGVWQAKADHSSSGRLMLTRVTPQGSVVGRVKVTARDLNRNITKTTDFYTTGVDQRCEVIVGMANAELTIEPYDEYCNVFIDDISVSSWCGNDSNRNGDDKVPLFTDEGFSTNTGFAGVGVWIRPESDAQLTTLPATYTGKQCLLLQRSRQNSTYGYKEVTVGGVTHTGNAMALYLPYSEAGYGPVSFRYRIPKLDEYGNQGELPSVRVMLQFIDDGPYNGFLGPNIPREELWVNVSQPIELRNTGGEWAMVSITPKLDNKELVGTEGTLRLVMVISKDMTDTDDPYVYIDDVRVTDNREGTTASWSATNVRVAATPVADLYWKDRAATDGVTPPEVTFAEKSSLTRAMQLNDVVTDEETEGSYGTTVIESPILEEGVGRVTFSARLMTPQTKPVRLYLCATTDRSDAMDDLQPVTYVEVANTVYKTYEIDLSKYRKYLTVPNEDGSPSDQASDKTFMCSNIRRLVLKAFVEGDGTPKDEFENTPVYGRVLVDQLSIANPVLPSIRVASVAFSNEPGTNSFNEFDARSPLSQPVANASVLRTMVQLDRAQLLKEDSVRVFLTVDPQAVEKYITGYEYNDVLGGKVTATPEHPVYAWNKANLSAWPLSAWFKSEDVFTKIEPALTNTKVLSRDDLNALGIPNSIELERDVNGSLCYYGEIFASFPELKLPENSLVRYNAWAIYQSEESNQWHMAQITPENYTEFPWYFPRSLNAELREKASEEAQAAGEEPMTADFFSPYYWVYSYLPGEAFINEFNLSDASGVKAADYFVELCAPVNTSFAGWRVEMTGGDGVNSIAPASFSIAPDTPSMNRLLLDPDVGAVPMQRQTATSALRAFYTALMKNPVNAVYYREGQEKVTALPKTKNAGVAERNLVMNYDLGSGHQAASVRLHRPTGGAEHIVCFTLNQENNANLRQSRENLENLHSTYANAYMEQGFGSEWYQTFTTSTWEDYVDAAPEAFGEYYTAKDHARRLVMAHAFPADSTQDDRYSPEMKDSDKYVNDIANSTYANSIATVDMGGVFVARKNAIDGDMENGPLDLTDVTVGTWPFNVNPTKQTRITEPQGGKDDLAPVVQVTPRQINPDQFLVLYSGFSACAVTSELSGRYGSHSIDTYGEDVNGQEVYQRTYAAGRMSPQTWGLAQDVVRTELTYQALPFHVVKGVTFRVKDASDAKNIITDAAELAQVIAVTGGTLDFAAISSEGWITITPNAKATSVMISSLTTSPSNAELRYSVEAKAEFEIDATGGDARKVITSVQPYCGKGSADYPVPGTAQYQPWLGNNFGFEVRYSDAVLNGAAVLDGVVITYPSPSANAAGIGAGLKSNWTGYAFETTDPADASKKRTVTLEGMEFSEAKALLNDVFMPEAGTRYVTLGRGTEGVIADASVIPTLGEAYARALGYDGTAATADKKEPAIPFCVWGIYTVSLPTDRGNEKVSFLMRQAMPGEVTEVANVWAQPAHYAPLADLNTGRANEEKIPYFYLYSTPPQSAWLNEVNTNLVNGDATEGADPFAEVTFPILRAGILNATAPLVNQADPAGWQVRSYVADGATADTYDCNVAEAAMQTSGSTSYKYLAVKMNGANALMAYVLHRPCGAAEGGVWVNQDADGGTSVAAPATLAQNEWLLAPESFVVPGKSDAMDVPGSVQLVGKTVLRDGALRLSSAVADRTEWGFATTSRLVDNNSIRPDTKPVWNQVTVTSVTKNNVYSGTPGGYQIFGCFSEEGMYGEEEPITLTQSGLDWVYKGQIDGTVISYHPRATYRFDTITIPAELIGKVMLVGNNGSLPATELHTKVQALSDAAALNPDAKYNQWLTLDGRAALEYHTITDDQGTRNEPTGKIIFNPDFVEDVDEDGEPITFGERDKYVISLVFMGEPSSAQNTIEVAFGQGEAKAGAWMVTQTMYALTLDVATGTMVPDATKGGAAVAKPIWSDEKGDVDGQNANVHGWLYQPLVGDSIGMTAVINPELGLQGGRLTDPVAMLSAEETSLRPFLVWTAIPKDRIPSNLFNPALPSAVSRNKFIENWGLNTWIGSPSVQDGVQIRLADLRRKLRAGTTNKGDSALYAAAGIIPMAYQGYCDKDGLLSTDPDEANRAKEDLLSFRTMTAEELEAALKNSASTGLTTEGTLDTDTNPLLPYTTQIDMTDSAIWQDGAILRFAIIIADPVSGYVYDCQSISNFSSKKLDAYCPWYIPDATTNVNRATSAVDAGGGVSPFAWIYTIPQGGVWINEFRPFANTTSEAKRIASAVELAMYASPLKETITDNTLANAPDTFTPTRTLDGWKIVTRYAPMPAVDANPSTPINWVTHKELPLHGWVPHRRILKSLAESTGNAPTYENATYDLDYYTVTVDAKKQPDVDLGSTLSLKDAFYEGAVYVNEDGTTNDSTFQWLNFDLTDEARELDADLFNADLQASLLSDVNGSYTGGVIYSIALMRNNGVVEDAVVFYNQSPYAAGSAAGDEFLQKRMGIVLESEAVNKGAANTVRAIINTALPNGSSPDNPAQLLHYTNSNTKATSIDWHVPNIPGTIYSTFSMPNGMETGLAHISYTQPYSMFVPNLTSLAAIEVHVTGGGAAQLSLTNNGQTEKGRDFVMTAIRSTGYELNLQNWDPAWYAPPTIMRDNKPFAPLRGYALATTYAADGTTTSNVLIDSDRVTEDTHYSVVFSYTAEAQALNLPEEMSDDFVAWLQQVAPAEVYTSPDVELIEAYWVGEETPATPADPKLSITHLGMYVDESNDAANAGQTVPAKPYICVQLKNGAEVVTSLKEGCNVVLLGKTSLTDAWTYVTTLAEGDIAANAEIFLTTDCKFFQVKLLSDAEVLTLRNPNP